VASIIKRPDFQARITADAMEPVANTPEEFAAQINEDLNEWAKLLKSAQIKLD